MHNTCSDVKTVLQEIEKELKEAGKYVDTPTMDEYQGAVDLWVVGCESMDSKFVDPNNFSTSCELAASLYNFWRSKGTYVIREHPDYADWMKLADKYVEVHEKLGMSLKVSDDRYHIALGDVDPECLYDLIGDALHYVTLHPVTLKLIFSPYQTEWFDEKGMYKGVVDWGTFFRDEHLTAATGYTTNSQNNYFDAPKFPPEDFKWTQHSSTGITLQDIVEVCYRLKVNKYDNWHELYTGFTNVTYKQHSQHDDESEVTFEVKFDHGS